MLIKEEHEHHVNDQKLPILHDESCRKVRKVMYCLTDREDIEVRLQCMMRITRGLGKSTEMGERHQEISCTIIEREG